MHYYIERDAIRLTVIYGTKEKKRERKLKTIWRSKTYPSIFFLDQWQGHSRQQKGWLIHSMQAQIVFGSTKLTWKSLPWFHFEGLQKTVAAKFQKRKTKERLNKCNSVKTYIYILHVKEKGITEHVFFFCLNGNMTRKVKPATVRL